MTLLKASGSGLPSVSMVLPAITSPFGVALTPVVNSPTRSFVMPLVFLAFSSSFEIVAVWLSFA